VSRVSVSFAAGARSASRSGGGKPSDGQLRHQLLTFNQGGVTVRNPESYLGAKGYIYVPESCTAARCLAASASTCTGKLAVIDGSRTKPGLLIWKG
jgi:hypothetical protein